MSSTPRGTSPTLSGTSPTLSSSVPPKVVGPSWADMEDDEDYGFDMPVQSLSAKKGDSEKNDTPSKDSVDTQPNPVSPDVDAANANANKQVSPPMTAANLSTNATAPATAVTKKVKKVTTPTATSGSGKKPETEATKTFVRQEMLARNLFPSFVEVTVDGAVPYSLKSTAAVSTPNTLSAEDLANAAGSTTSNPATTTGNSPTMPTQHNSNRRAFEGQPALPAAIAATANINVADRSHLGRRRRAIRVIADSLVSNGGKAMAVCEVAKVTKWNKTFRPGLGCLFSFIKGLPAFFVYKHGEISLTYEEDIASTMLRTWSDTDAQAAELNNIAASNAALLAGEKLLKEKVMTTGGRGNNNNNDAMKRAQVTQ